MIRLTRIKLLLFTAATVLFSHAAHALPQKFVSSSGNDANLCDRATPCRTFTRALAKVDPSGEIIVLDSGEYGVVTINKSVRITAEGVYAWIDATTSGKNAITIQAAPVSLKGLTLNGKGGLYGIYADGGGPLHIEGCVVSGFAGTGIYAVGKTYIKDSVVRNNASYGILAGSGVTIDNCRMEQNSVGVFAVGPDPFGVTVKNSVASHNSTAGFYGNNIIINIVNSEAVYNAGNGFFATIGGVMNAEHCLSANNSANGFVAQQGAVVNLKDCTSAYNANSGMTAVNSSKIRVEDCEITDNKGNGLYVYSGGAALISNSLVTGNYIGLRNDLNSPGVLETFANNQVHANRAAEKSGTITAVPQGLTRAGRNDRRVRA